MTRGGVHRVTKGLLFVSPYLTGFCLLMVYPLIMSVYYSLTEFDGTSTPTFVGFANYRELLGDELFWLSLWNTAYYVAIAVPLGIVLALALSLLLNMKLRGMAFYRALFFIPSIIPVVAVTVLWIWFLNPQYGVVNGLLRSVGLAGPAWLGSPRWIKPALIMMSLWGVGGNMVLYLAALQDVPQHLYEAAEIDGASRWQQVWHITLPSISPIIFFTFIMGLIGGFQYFAQAYVITGGSGGPGDGALFYCLYLFRKAFFYHDMGGASAMAWLLFVVILLATLATMRLSRNRVHYEGV